MTMACVSMRDAKNHTGCTLAHLESLRELYEDARRESERQLAQARAGVAAYAEETAAFVASAGESLAKFMDFFNGVHGALGTLGVETDDGLDWLNMDASLFGAAVPAWPSTVGILSGVDAVPSASYIYEAVADHFDDFLDQLDEASKGVNAAAVGMGAALEEVVATFAGLGAADYQPPKYADYAPGEDDGKASDESEEGAKHDKETDSFVAGQASSLNAFAELSAYMGDDASLSPYNLSLGGAGDDGLTFSGLTFRFEEGYASTIDWDLLQVGVVHVVNLLMLVDFAYRFFKTLYYIRKFWSRAGLYIPPVDVRQDKIEFKLPGAGGSGGAGATAASGGGGGSCCIACVLCPCWGALLCLAFSAFIVFNMFLLYIPVVDEYTRVCVNGHGNGTFITSNLYSVSYNYAAEAGNEDLTKGMQDYNVRTADYCGEYTTFTQEQQAEDELLLLDLQTSQAHTRDDLLLMDQCVNASLMDWNFGAACCGGSSAAASGGAYSVSCAAYGTSEAALAAMNRTCPDDVNGDPFPMLSGLLDATNPAHAAAACLADPATWALGDASFYCSHLPACEVTCNGPNKELIKEATRQCGCFSEWLMHTWWAQVLGALVVYAILNASRVVVLDGLSRLCWKLMSPNCFTYRATTTLDGNYIGPPSSAKYPSFKKMLSVELSAELAAYERKGWVLVILGLALNYAWVYYFVYFSDDRLYYDPNA